MTFSNCQLSGFSINVNRVIIRDSFDEMAEIYYLYTKYYELWHTYTIYSMHLQYFSKIESHSNCNSQW